MMGKENFQLLKCKSRYTIYINCIPTPPPKKNPNQTKPHPHYNSTPNADTGDLRVMKLFFGGRGVLFKLSSVRFYFCENANNSSMK